jgi:hypothetical protein
MSLRKIQSSKFLATLDSPAKDKQMVFFLLDGSEEYIDCLFLPDYVSKCHFILNSNNQIPNKLGY